MACALTELNSAAACDFIEGGILYSYAVDLSKVTAITLTSGVISNLTMSTPGQFVRWDYDQDATANFGQTGARNANQITIEQAAFLKFKGYTAAYVDAANKAIQCCNVLVIHVLSNGTRVVQGLEQSSGASGGFVKTKVLETRVVPNLMTGTTQEEARLEFNVSGTSRSFTLTTSLTDAAIEAL